MNIELQVKMLYANADKLDEAGFVADFYYIAKEYARQQLLQQTPCTTLYCDCQIPKPIDPYHDEDKHICRDCNRRIAI